MGHGDLSNAFTFDTGYNPGEPELDLDEQPVHPKREHPVGNLGASLTFGVASRPRKKDDPNGWNASIGVTGDGAYSHAVTTKSDFSNSTGLNVQKPNTSDLVMGVPFPGTTWSTTSPPRSSRPRRAT